MSDKSESDTDSGEKLHEDNINKVAYLRLLPSSPQCELRFHFADTIENFGPIDTEVRAVRQSKDTIGSLLLHTKNKLINIIKTKQKENNGNETSDESTPIDICLYRKKGKQVKDSILCRELINNGTKNLIFKVCNQRYKVFINAPLITQITLPVVIYANCTIQPIRFKSMYTEKALSKFTWYKSSDKVVWTKIGDKYTYKTNDEDVEHYLKFSCDPRNKKNCPGEPCEIISEKPVDIISGIPQCPFEERHKMTETFLKGKLFRVVSYNTLSDRYNETNEQFPYCPPQALAIDYRKQLILKEILGYNADIVCLQEVDFKVYLHYFKKEFKNAGYECSYHKKGNRLTEGLMCIYQRERFKLLETTQLVLSEHINTNGLFSHIWAVVKENKALREMFLKQVTSLQVTILKFKQMNEIIIVANTHLYYHAEAFHVRLVQIAIIMTYLGNVRSKLIKQNKCGVSVLFCGDLNSVPTSGVYHLITNGDLPQDREDYKKITYKSTNILQHSLKLKSACGTPEYTNYTSDFKGCLDYIFYDTMKIGVQNCIPLPDVDVLTENTALPSVVFPSDHIALVADLKLL